LKIRPCTLKQANELVGLLHRHHVPVRGHRFSIALYKNDVLCGVAIVGKPVARMTDSSRVAEVLRLCTDGTPNACSKLLGACARISKEMGFDSVQTFTLETEHGVSLRAAGWIEVGKTSGGSWNRPSRGGRRDDQPLCVKRKWVRSFTDPKANQIPNGSR